MKATATPASGRVWKAAEELPVALELEFPRLDAAGFVLELNAKVDEREVEVATEEVELDELGLEALEAVEELDDPAIEVEVVAELELVVELVVELDVEICIGTPYLICHCPGETTTTGDPFAFESWLGVPDTDVRVDRWGSITVVL
jgi:hypothetical protein